MAKVLYFTAGPVATTEEKAAIAALALSAEAPIIFGVRSATGDHNFGSGPEPTDYVYGTVPTAYNAKPVYDPEAPPAPSVGSSQAVVTDGIEVEGVTLTGTAGASKTMVLTIVDGEITAATFT